MARDTGIHDYGLPPKNWPDGDEKTEYGMLKGKPPK
jgi:hypothetical protein